VTASGTSRSGSRATTVVAIDGPSGSGKSTVARAVAKALGVGYLDTGAMYRAVTWWCLEHDIALDDHDTVARAAQGLDLTVGTDPDAPWVQVAGHDISRPIRETRISSRVSAVATNLDVRANLRQRQRVLIAECAQRTGGCVVEGRDITTVVAPDADVRVLLTASEDARLARRTQELHGGTDAESLAATRDQIVRRDHDDSTVSQFRSAAEGVVLVDTSQLDLADSVAAVLEVVHEHAPV
jgi:CMP/dCMP kinase